MTMLETMFAMCHELLDHGEVQERPGVKLYPASVRYARGGVCFLARTEEGKALWTAGGELPALFYGRLRRETETPVKSAPLDGENAQVLLELFPELGPVALPEDRPVLGVLDPLGRSAAAVMKAAERTGAFPVPVRASMEDLALLGMTYEELLAPGVFAAFELGAAGGWGAVADRISEEGEALYAADCGMSCLTLGKEADREGLQGALESLGIQVELRTAPPKEPAGDEPWLEALRLAAIMDPMLYRLIHDFAREETGGEGVFPLRERTDPELERYLDEPAARRMLSAAAFALVTARSDTGGDRFRSRLLSLLDRYEQEYTALAAKALEKRQ